MVSEAKAIDEKHTLNITMKQLKGIEDHFKLSKEEICDIYTKVSGDTSAVRKHLEGKKVVIWNELEDMALVEPDNSPEF